HPRVPHRPEGPRLHHPHHRHRADHPRAQRVPATGRHATRHPHPRPAMPVPRVPKARHPVRPRPHRGPPPRRTHLRVQPRRPVPPPPPVQGHRQVDPHPPVARRAVVDQPHRPLVPDRPGPVTRTPHPNGAATQNPATQATGTTTVAPSGVPSACSAS